VSKTYYGIGQYEITNVTDDMKSVLVDCRSDYTKKLKELIPRMKACEKGSVAYNAYRARYHKLIKGKNQLYYLLENSGYDFKDKEEK